MNMLFEYNQYIFIYIFIIVDDFYGTIEKLFIFGYISYIILADPYFL